MTEPIRPYRKPGNAGRWRGKTFVFHEPVIMVDAMNQEMEVHVLDFAVFDLDNRTPEDVIHAILNPIYIRPEAGDEHTTTTEEQS